MKQFLTEWRKFLLENKEPKLLDVPDIRQFNDYSCGSACLLAILAFYDLYDKNEKELTKELNTNSEDGTSLKAIKRVAEKHGLNCSVRKECDLDELKSSLSNGNPVILNFQAWSKDKKPNWKKDWKDGHYAVLVGMDEENLYMRDPSIYNKVGTLPVKEFMDRWHDMGKDKEKLYNVAIFFSGKEKSEQEFEKIK
jgi:predicted double-glycine peptidase